MRGGREGAGGKGGRREAGMRGRGGGVREWREGAG